MRGPERVQAALKATGLDVKPIRLQKSARTAQLAAEALNTALGSIVKSLVFLADGEPVLVLVAGDRRADPVKLKRLLGARRVMIADAERVKQETGFSIGGVPPIGHRQSLPTLIDASLARFETLYAAAGHPFAVFPVAFETLVHITNGQVADVTEIPLMEEKGK
ncbi:MAG: YbaK/EbsC family protein [Chloroflexota bacterium]|nr:MAG: YbaK/EbsC family protein [Chloroflexota bacterium]